MTQNEAPHLSVMSTFTYAFSGLGQASTDESCVEKSLEECREPPHCSRSCGCLHPYSCSCEACAVAVMVLSPKKSSQALMVVPKAWHAACGLNGSLVKKLGRCAFVPRTRSMPALQKAAAVIATSLITKPNMSITESHHPTSHRYDPGCTLQE